MIKHYAVVISALGALMGLNVADTALAQTSEPVLAPAPARETRLAVDDELVFGNPRQWAFSTDAGFQISRSSYSNSDGATVQLTIQPALDYFVIKNLSVGGSVGLTYVKAGDQKGVLFNIGPRVGYNFELPVKNLSIWPKLGFSFAHSNRDGNNVYGRADSNSLAINLFAPVVLHPAPHFFAGIGPFLDADLSGDNRNTTWGLKLTLGGWIQGKG
ncbi:MAG: hypothetical protein ABW352_22645 [Polyangiales bacterium]